MGNILIELAELAHRLAAVHYSVGADTCNDAIVEITQLQAALAKLPKCWRLNDEGKLDRGKLPSL